MTTYRATLTIEIERADGSRTLVTETAELSADKNRCFERSASEEVAHRAMRNVLHRVDPEFVRANA